MIRDQPLETVDAAFCKVSRREERVGRGDERVGRRQKKGETRNERDSYDVALR